MPPGTSAADATAFLKSKGFIRVYVDTAASPHELRAQKRLGACFLNFTFDDLYLTSTLDESDRVRETTMHLGIEPGI